MRLTFPPISSTGPTRLLSLVALACVPTAVNIVAKKVFGTFCERRQTFFCSLGTSLVSMLTLVKNPLAAAASTVPLYLYLAHCASASRARPETPQWKIQNIIPVVSRLIEVLQTGDNANTAGLYQHDVDVVARLQRLDKCYAKGQNGTIDDYFFNSLTRLQAASLFKALFKRLDTPLLENIQAQLLALPWQNEQDYLNALNKLEKNQYKLLKMTIEHLTFISNQHGSEKELTSLRLARWFAPLFFNIPKFVNNDAVYIDAVYEIQAVNTVKVFINHPEFFKAQENTHGQPK